MWKDDQCSITEMNTEEDDGIFKAVEDRSEMWGASEVQEDENTKVEVPVDQRVAETVEEEVMKNEDHDGKYDDEGGETGVDDEHNNPQEHETSENEDHSMAEYSLPRPTSSRLLEKISTPSEAEKKEYVAVA